MRFSFKVKLDSGKIVFLIKPEQTLGEDLRKVRERSDVAKHLVRSRLKENERHQKHQLSEENCDDEDEDDSMEAQVVSMVMIMIRSTGILFSLSRF